MVKIVLVAGSVRQRSQTHRVAEIAEAQLQTLGAQTDLISLRDVDVPLWSEEKGADDKPADSFWATEWPSLSERVAAADGFVFLTPEWHGMATPHLKNFIFCCEAKELAFKPAYLITVSGSVGGTHPVAELRMSSYKNTYLHWLPDHLIIRNVGGFSPGEEGDSAPPWLLPRMVHGLRVLTAYAEAVRPVRETVVDLELLKTGM